MAKCPKCSKEITYLNYWSKTWAEFSLAGYGYHEPPGALTPDVDESENYECPECGEVLFHDHDEAEKFLKGVSPCP